MVEYSIEITERARRDIDEAFDYIAFHLENPQAAYNLTDAIQQKLIPDAVTRAQMNIIYASEADVLNVALFGMTHQQWQVANPTLKGNQRDYATINQLICISNMENINAVMINEGIPQPQRLKRLNEIAIQQMRILSEVDSRKYLK